MVSAIALALFIDLDALNGRDSIEYWNSTSNSTEFLESPEWQWFLDTLVDVFVTLK